MKPWMAGSLAVALTLVAGTADARDVAGAQYRQWSFSNDDRLRDPIVYVNAAWLHAQLEIWDFDRGEDQVRPELGIVLKDQRRSAYTAQWRGERRADRFTLGTEQVASDLWVVRGEVSPIVRVRGRTLTVWSAGADYYWGSYSFAGGTLIRDPRASGLWVVPLRARIASESNDWLQLTVAPASERSLGWAVEGKRGWVRGGFERNSRFDFTDVNSITVTFGVEVPLSQPE